MNTDGGQLNLSIRLLNEQLRRDAQMSMRQFDNIGRSATQAGATVDRSMNNMSKSVTGAIRSMTNGIQTAMAEMAKDMLGITALLSSGAFLKSLYDESKAFNREMKVVSTISEEVTQNMEKYKEQVLQLCTQIAVAPDTAAQALYQINSAGHLGADGMKVLESSARAAIGGVTDTAVAADAITTILNAYHKSADEAESISDKLFTTVRLGKTTMGELGQNISTVAPLAARYKISIDEILAAVAQLTKQGNNTASAMTQISASIIAVGNELGDNAFKNGLMAGLDEIEKRANGSNMALKAQLSNIRAVRGAMGLTGDSAKETAQMIEDIRNSAGATAEACQKMNSLGSAEARKLKTNFLKEFASMGDGMSKTSAGLARTLNQAFESGEMSKVLSVLKDLIITYGIYKTLIITLTALNRVYKNVMSQVAYQKVLAATQQKALNTQEALGAVITTNLKRAVQALNTALKQNSFGLVVAAVAVAAYGIYKYCTRVSEAEKATKRLQEATSKMTQEASDERRKVLELLTTLKTAKKDTDDYKKAKQSIIDQYGTYLSKITNEKGEITNLAEAYRILTNEINRAARARAMEDLNAQAAEDFADTNKSKTEQLKKWLKRQGVSDSDVDFAAGRILTSIRETGALPTGIQQQYGLTANVVENALRQLFLSQTGYTPEVRQENADKAVTAWHRASAGRTDLSENDVRSLLDQAGYGEYFSILNSNELLYRRYAQNAMNGLLENHQTYQSALRQNELYTGMHTPDASLFEGIQEDKFESDLNYLKNTVLPKFTNGDYGAGGVRFKFSGTKQQTFRTQEELQSFIQQMELELQNRQTAASLGTGGEESGGGGTKTIAEQVEEMISQSRTETNADKLNQLKEKMKDMLDGGQIDITSTDYKNLKAAYDALKKRFPGASDGSSNGTPQQRQAAAAAAHQAELDLIDSQTRERIRAEEDAEFQVQQARIDAMESGADKILAQRELDYQKQQAELQREMEDAILEEIARQKALFDAQEETADANAKRSGNKNYAKRTFNTGGLLATSTVGEDGEATQNYTAGQLLAQGTIGNVDTSVINEILRRYEELFANMQTTHNDAWRRPATDAMNEYLAQWGQGMEKRNAIIALATNRMAAAETDGERKSIFAQMQKDVSDLDIEANKKTSAISTLFDDMTEKTVADMKKIYAQGQETLAFLEGGKWNAETGLKLSISEETFNVLSKSPEEIERVRKGVKQLKGEIDGTESGFKKLGTGLSDLFKAGDDPKKLEKALGKIREGMQAVLQVGGFLKDSLAQLGEAFGSDTLGDIAEGIGVAMEAMDGAMQGAEAGAAFGPWGAAAGAAIGLVSSLGSAIAKLHDAKHEKRIEDLQDQIEVLAQNYDDLGRAVEKAYSKDAKKLIEQQNTLLRQQKQLIQNQIAEEKAKKSSDEDRIKDWEQQIHDIDNTIADNKEKAIDAIFGEDVQAAIDRFSDAYASMFDAGASRARASKDLVKDMIKNMIIEAMKADISEPMEKLREMMTGFWSDEFINDREQEQLENYVENMFEEQEKKWGWADGYFKDSTSQGSSKGGFTTMSQDSADELNGRFTALQIAGEQIKATTADINEQLKGIAARSIQTASAVDEIRGLQLIAVDHLETIRKHTANLAEMNERLGKIEKYTSRI